MKSKIKRGLFGLVLLCCANADGYAAGSADDASALFGNVGFSDTRVQIPNPALPPVVADKNAPADKQAKVPVHGGTTEEQKAMAAQNRALREASEKSAINTVPGKYRPYADYEKPGYLIMSSDFEFSSRQAKLEAAKNLPPDATLIIYADKPDDKTKEEILNAFETAVPRKRIKLISLANSRAGFWARDGIPVPVFNRDNALTVIDAKYMFEPDAEIARLFNAGLEKNGYNFQGGNFQASHSGDCLVVNGDYTAEIPDDIFTGLYGCKQLIRLPFASGIGHIDERARFINENTIVTDTPKYKELLEAKGFAVHLLPRPAHEYETYVNSLILSGRVIVPVFGQPTDAQALAVYEQLGLKATGVQSSELSNKGLGSVHCITMTYPRVPMADLLKRLNAKEF